MAKIHKFGLANSSLDSPMATWLTLTGTLNLMVTVIGQFNAELGLEINAYHRTLGYNN